MFPESSLSGWLPPDVMHVMLTEVCSGCRLPITSINFLVWIHVYATVSFKSKPKRQQEKEVLAVLSRQGFR